MTLETHRSKSAVTRLLTHRTLRHIPSHSEWRLWNVLVFYNGSLRRGQELSVAPEPFFFFFFFIFHSAFPSWVISSSPIALLVIHGRMSDQTISTPIPAEHQLLGNRLTDFRLQTPRVRAGAPHLLSPPAHSKGSAFQWPVPFSAYFFKPDTPSTLFLALSAPNLFSQSSFSGWSNS